MKLVLALLLLSLLQSPAFASSTIVINEVLPDPSGGDKENEWVELYNPISTNISLNGYVLEDKNRKRITLSGEISKWLVIYPKGLNGFALTNTGSTLKLFTASDSAEPIDTFSYGNSTSDKSWGRIPDGGSINDQKLDPSPGTTNQLPFPTTTITPTPAPTSTTAPTDVPTPSPTPTTAVPATTIPTVKSTIRPTPTEEPLVLGEETSEPTVPETIHETAENQTPPTFIERFRSLIPTILIVVGAALTIGSGVPLLIQEIRSRKKPV